MTKTLGNPLKDFDLGRFYNKYGTVVIFVGIFILASIISPAFFTTGNLTNVIRQMAVVALLAFGQTFIITMGHIDVSVGSVLALTGCMAAKVMNVTGNIYLAVFVGLGAGCIIGLLNGFVITRYNIPAFIMTLAMTTIARGAVLLFTDAIPITDLGIFGVIGQGHIGIVPVPVVILVAFLFISWILLEKTTFGRYVYATGGNKIAAAASGINTNKVTIMAFLYNGILASAAGIVLMSRIYSGQPAIGEGYEFYAISAVVVGGTSLMGGTGSIWGTLIGALIIFVISNVQNLMNVNSYWQLIVRGIIIAGAVILDVKTKTKKVTKKV